jgi:hypothetical protein
MARDYGFHHLNSRETKYNNWADFDFSDFEWIDVDKPEVLQNYLMIPKDLVIPPSCSNILMQVALLPAPIYDPNFPIVQLVQKQCDHYTHLLSIVGLASCHPSLFANYLTLATLYCEQAEVLSKPPKKVPCPGDPMIDLAIAPTTIGSIKGGRWGIGNRTDEKLRPKNHKGIDLKAQINSSFVAMYKGTVENAEYIEKEPNIKEKPCYIDPKDGICKGDWGNFIKISSTVNGKEIITLYGHLNQMEVKKGQIVQQGDVLGLTGITGNASSNKDIIPHLHVEIEEKINGVWIRVDPEKYLSTKFDAAGNKDPNTGNCKQ